MPRVQRRAPATANYTLLPVRTHCVACGQTMWIAYHTHRTVTTLAEIAHFTDGVFVGATIRNAHDIIVLIGQKRRADGPYHMASLGWM